MECVYHYGTSSFGPELNYTIGETVKWSLTCTIISEHKTKLDALRVFQTPRISLPFSKQHWSRLFVLVMALFKFLFEHEVWGIKWQKCKYMSKRNQMINFELNWSSGNVITLLFPWLQNQHSDKDYTSFILSRLINLPHVSSISATISHL